MKLAILSRNAKLHSVARLIKEAKALRVQVQVVNPLDCQVLVAKGYNALFLHEKPLWGIDVVLPRIGTSITEYGLAVVKQFELQGVKVINNSTAIAQSRDKFRSLQILSEKGLEVPITVLMRSPRASRLALRLIQGVPAVIKVNRGTQGVGVMLTESASSTQSVLETMWSLEQDVLLQQYVRESAGRDIRAFVIGDQVVAAMRRQAKEGEFRSNIHRGGEGIIVELKENYRRAAIQAARAVGLSVAGVDILETLAGPKIIEVNSSPGFEGIEAATKINVARMIIQHAIHVHRGIAKKPIRAMKLKK